MTPSTLPPHQQFTTLDEIRQRKAQLSTQLQQENEQFSKLWHGLFVKRSEVSKGEWVSTLVANSVTAIDAFLLVRKIMKSYGHIFGKSKKRK